MALEVIIVDGFERGFGERKLGFDESDRETEICSLKKRELDCVSHLRCQCFIVELDLVGKRGGRAYFGGIELTMRWRRG